MYEIRISTGDCAQAESLGAALSAARQLVRDAVDFGSGASSLLRKEIMIWRDGQYDGLATSQARGY